MDTISPEMFQLLTKRMEDVFNELRQDSRQNTRDMMNAINTRLETMLEELRKSQEYNLNSFRETMAEGFDRVHQDCSELALRFDRLDRSFDRHVSSNRQTYRRDLQPFVLREPRRSDGSIFPSLSQ